MTGIHSAFAAIVFPQIDPILFQIGPFAIRWYALAYIAGLILGWLYCARLAEASAYWGGASPVKRQDIDDLLIWVAFGVIAGGRLGYVLFYSPAYFAQNPGEILAVWQGGMSFHGGMLGSIAGVVAFTRKRGLPFLPVMDLVAAAGPVGLFFGRLANFINQELYGRVSDVPWAVIFPVAGPEPRHPSQLYEAALEGLLLFLVLRFLVVKYQALTRPGLVGGTFLLGYGVARIAVEFFRTPDEHIGYLAGPVTMGMVLSLPLVIVGAGVILYARRSEPLHGVK